MKKNLYLGLDIGGTKINAVLLHGLAKQRVKVISRPTPKAKLRLEKELLSFLKQLLGIQAKKLSCIGVGLAGVIDRKRGIVVKAANLPWLNGWNVAEFLKRHFRVPVRLDNDVRCFLRAEAAWGRARGKKDVVAVAIGTGIGGGIMSDSRIMTGTHGSAGEFGHMVIKTKDQRPKTKNLTWEDLGSLRAFQKWGDRSEIIGIGIANLINALDPEMVVIGGGAVHSPAFRLEIVKKTARRFIISPLGKRTPIVRGALGHAAQAIGAALLFSMDKIG